MKKIPPFMFIEQVVFRISEYLKLTLSEGVCQYKCDEIKQINIVSLFMR
jgi:hypothetical protein